MTRGNRLQTHVNTLKKLKKSNVIRIQDTVKMALELKVNE